MIRTRIKQIVIGVSALTLVLTASLMPVASAMAYDAGKAEAQLNDQHVPQSVKEAIMRLLVRDAIRKNEAQQVVTDVTITDLKTQRTLVSHNQDTEHFAASINKVPVALLALQELRAGHVSLDQIVSWQASDVRGGFGFYDQPGAPLQATWGEVLNDMLNRSGNTVVRVVVNYMLGGAAAVNARWATMPELSHTYLMPLDANRFYLGNSTSRDSLWALQQLLAQSDQYSELMKQAMATNIFDTFGTRSQLAGNDYIVLANKVGILDDVDGNNRHDVGIVYNTRTQKTYGYSFFTTAPYNAEDPSATARAEQSLKDMGGVTLRYAGDKARAQGARTLQQLVPERKVLY